MKTRFSALLLIATFCLSPLTAFAKPDLQAERVCVAFLLALGRVPSSSEVTAWSKQGAPSVAELLTRQRQQLQSDAALKRATVTKAAEDAFGRPPTERELNATTDPAPTYTELMEQHLQSLQSNPTEYAQMIERAYQLVIHRSAFSIEIEYWKERPLLPFTMLVGCVEDWGRRNAPGLMATTGTPTVSINSNYLTTLRLSPDVAQEARLAAGLAPSGSPVLAIAAGRNLVAPGADQVVTGGHMHFAAVGADNLVP